MNRVVPPLPLQRLWRCCVCKFHGNGNFQLDVLGGKNQKIAHVEAWGGADAITVCAWVLHDTQLRGQVACGACVFVLCVVLRGARGAVPL